MEDVIQLNKITDFPPIEQSSVRGYIKHVQCEGARFHVVHYDTLGSHCSEPTCIINANKSS